MNQNYLKLLIGRDPRFLDSVFKETNPYLFRILGAQKVFGSEAEELVQMAWETFFAKLEKFEGKSQIKVFIAGILINKLREHRRAQKRIVSEEDAEKIYGQAFTNDGWWNTEPADPARLFESKESRRFIEECLQGLSETQREAFVLREIEGENSENICNILGLNVSHLGVLLFRAKDKLRKCLEGKLG